MGNLGSGIADMQSVISEANHWLSNFGFAIIFNDFPPEALGPFALNFVRRVHTAFVK